MYFLSSTSSLCWYPSRTQHNLFTLTVAALIFPKSHLPFSILTNILVLWCVIHTACCIPALVSGLPFWSRIYSHAGCEPFLILSFPRLEVCVCPLQVLHRFPISFHTPHPPPPPPPSSAVVSIASICCRSEVRLSVLVLVVWL